MRDPTGLVDVTARGLMGCDWDIRTRARKTTLRRFNYLIRLAHRVREGLFARRLGVGCLGGFLPQALDSGREQAVSNIEAGTATHAATSQKGSWERHRTSCRIHAVSVSCHVRAA